MNSKFTFLELRTLRNREDREVSNVGLLQEHGLCSEEWLSAQEAMQLSKEGSMTKRGGASEQNYNDYGKTSSMDEERRVEERPWSKK